MLVDEAVLACPFGEFLNQAATAIEDTDSSIRFSRRFYQNVLRIPAESVESRTIAHTDYRGIEFQVSSALAKPGDALSLSE